MEDSAAFQNEWNSIKKKKDRNAGFILDRGYFSRENIRYMDKCRYDFVIMVKGMKSFVNDAIRQVQGTFEYVWLKMQDNHHKKTKKHEMKVFTMYKGWDEEKDKAGKSAPKGLSRARR